MIIYEATKLEFMNHVTEDSIATNIYEVFYEKIGKTSIKEIESWNNSMNYMYKVLNDAIIPDDIPIAIEYRVPATSRRIDFIVSGLNNDDSPSVIIIELKQWSKIEAVEDEDE